MRKLIVALVLCAAVLVPTHVLAADAGTAKGTASAVTKAPSKGTAAGTAPAIVVTGKTKLAKPELDGGIKVTSKPKAAAAPTLPAPDDISGIFNGLVAAVRGGAWGLAIAFLSMLLTWLLRNFLQGKLPKKALPWISAGLGALQAIGLSLVAGIPWYWAAIGGISAGLSGAGLFSAIGKSILKNWGKTAEVEASKS